MENTSLLITLLLNYHIWRTSFMKQGLIFMYFILFWGSGDIFAQSFFPGIVQVTAGVGFGGGPTIIEDPSPTAKTTGAAIYRTLPFSAEIGLSNHMGIGFQFRSDKYVNNTDSVNALASNYSLICNYHFVVTHQTNSFVGIKTGISNFTFEKVRTPDIFEKKGPVLQLCAGVNMFIQSKIGLQLNLGWNTMIYRNGSLIDANTRTRTPYGVTVNGIEFGLSALYVL